MVGYHAGLPSFLLSLSVTSSQISDDRYKIWPQSPPNLCRKAPVYALLRAPLFSPMLWQCDDRQNRRFPVLQQPANQPALIETDSWKVWRRYSFGGNAALADGCYELNWPYWLSDEVSRIIT